MSPLLNVENILYTIIFICLHEHRCLHLVVPKKSMIVVLVRAIGFGTLWLVSSLPASRSNTFIYRQVSWVSGFLREETFKYPSFPTATATSGSCWWSAAPYTAIRGSYALRICLTVLLGVLVHNCCCFSFHFSSIVFVSLLFLFFIVVVVTLSVYLSNRAVMLVAGLLLFLFYFIFSLLYNT